MRELIQFLKLTVLPYLALHHGEDVFPSMYSLSFLEIHLKSGFYKYSLIAYAFIRPKTNSQSLIRIITCVLHYLRYKRFPY